MKRSFYFIALLIIVLISMSLLSSCSTVTQGQDLNEATNISEVSEEKIDTEKILKEAEKIVIEEDILSLGKKYNILVDEEHVATVTGKIINAFGDVFILKDINDNVLAQEKQIKRWGLKLNRCAEISDSEGNITGYIGEETQTKLFSIGYYFHFYDAEKNEIGISDQINFTLLKENNFNDLEGNIDYEVKASFSLFDRYELIVNDSSNIPLYNAIFMVCIEDAIKDAED